MCFSFTGSRDAETFLAKLEREREGGKKKPNVEFPISHARIENTAVSSVKRCGKFTTAAFSPGARSWQV